MSSLEVNLFGKVEDEFTENILWISNEVFVDIFKICWTYATSNL